MIGCSISRKVDSQNRKLWTCAQLVFLPAVPEFDTGLYRMQCTVCGLESEVVRVASGIHLAAKSGT